MGKWDGQQAFDEKLKALKKPSASKIREITDIAVATECHGKYYKHVVACVEGRLHKSSPSARYALLCIMDAICRVSRTKHGSTENYVPRFGKNLEQSLVAVAAASKDDKENAKRMIQLWEQQAMFPTALLKPAKAAFEWHLSKKATGKAKGADNEKGGAGNTESKFDDKTPGVSPPHAPQITSPLSPRSPLSVPSTQGRTPVTPNQEKVPQAGSTLAQGQPHSVNAAVPLRVPTVDKDSGSQPYDPLDPSNYVYSDDEDDEVRIAKQRQRVLEEEARAKALPPPAPAGLLGSSPAPVTTSAPLNGWAQTQSSYPQWTNHQNQGANLKQGPPRKSGFSDQPLPEQQERKRKSRWSQAEENEGTGVGRSGGVIDRTGGVPEKAEEQPGSAHRGYPDERQGNGYRSQEGNYAKEHESGWQKSKDHRNHRDRGHAFSGKDWERHRDRSRSPRGRYDDGHRDHHPRSRSPRRFHERGNYRDSRR